MFSRALLVALCIVYATSLSPLTAPADDDCALYLTGPGRSSAYDYSLNLLKGNFAYDGQHTCITYDAINQAYLDARTRILVSQPKGDWKAEDFASVGELLLDISISLARTYGLTYEEIEKGLPLIDTSRTLIREACPPVFSHVECRAGKYRRLDGLCNNLRHPTWGATMAPFQRLIGPLFADGINAPRISHTGHDLPLSRVVSRTMHPDDGFHDHAGTVMVIAWGQFMDHDYTLTGTPLDPVHRNDPEECCKRPLHLKHPYCNEIRVPDDDYFYRLFGVKCIDFVRGFPSPRPGCRLGSRVPFNTLTGAIDGNTVYGVTEKFARKLRTGYGGLLRMNPVFKEYGLKDLLPLKLDIPDEGCTRPNKNMYCFEAGEIRVNEQLVLTVMHTLMAREHNRVAEGLAAVNPHWDDETLFQEARRINIAEIQHITYNEFLPILLGKDVMEKFGLVLEKEGYWDGYDPEVNPDVIDSFAAAAYRFGHSLLPTAVERWSKAHKFIASKRLSDLIRRPYDLYRAGVLDEYVMGLMNQVAQAMDDSITQEVTNHLFKKVGARFGMDLVSFNMQRGREFGLPGYMEFRKFCGLSGADSFQDLFGSMPNETVHKYETIFEHPIDVDLWSGGVSERPLPGSMLGPTFACIIATQFSYSRRGDRFWFELPKQPSSFTPEQMVEIRKSRLARVICDNTDIIDTVQLYPMVLPDHELNPRVPCRSGIIPSMDFSKWAEPAPFLGGAKEYMTDAYMCNTTNIHLSNNTLTENVTDVTPITKNSTVIVYENCNDTDIHNSPQPNKLNLIILAQDNSQIAEFDVKNKNNTDCEERNKDEIVNNQLQNKVENADTVLKYVYKKGDKIISDKTEGHVRNRVKRKKRNIDDEGINHPPLLLNLNTKHENKEIEELNLPQFTPDGFIKRENLADFNIGTLHEHIKLNNNNLLDHNINYNRGKHKNVDENREIEPENTDSEEKEKLRYLDDESQENIRNDSNSSENNEEDTIDKQHVTESGESDFYQQNNKNESQEKYSNFPGNYENEEAKTPFIKEKLENVEKYIPREVKTDSVENEDLNNQKYVSKENESIKQEDEYTHTKQNTESELSSENYQNDKSDENPSYSSKEPLNEPDTHENLNNSDAIQEGDLGDFSYESSQENDKGHVENTKDINENNHNKSHIKNVYNKEPYTNQKNEHSTDHSATDDNVSIEPNNDSNEYEKQVSINDGEIKPVIELNNEDNDESNEEESKENTKDNINSNLSENLDENINSDNSKDIELNSEVKSEEDEKNVKQQFERIPPNYNHAVTNSNKNESKKDNYNENEDSDGTLDTITPTNIKFDDNLGIKFDEIAIKLPTINLPDDILAYATEEPIYKKNVDKNENNHHYDDSNEDIDDEVNSKNDENSENQHDFYESYFDEPNEKLQEPILYNEPIKNKEEDLYEKFVRERFGIMDSLKKRSQKLIDKRQKLDNPNLYEKIQKVLKKADNIEKEAQNSGDPKAGYSWTLEYGENL